MPINKKSEKQDIRVYDLDQINNWVAAQGQPSFRANQIFEWLWKKHVFTFEEMTNLSLEFRAKLQNDFVLRPLVLDAIQKSTDGTIKSRFVLHDGHFIESVLIPVPRDNRYTVCVSTQVGCSLTCAFCATGQMNRARNLTAAEIVDQVVLVNQQCQQYFDYHLTNIVYMGMGEPLLNYSQTMKSIEMITSQKGLNWSPKRITVSTAGIAKMIKKLADEGFKSNLALSLHAADDRKRNEIMPINATNSLEELENALVYFYRKTKNQISYEYISFLNFNDSIEDAHALAKLCKKFPVKVNIIEYNPIEGLSFQKTEPLTLDKFAQTLRSYDIIVTVRRSRGKDIDAACGQLANK